MNAAPKQAEKVACGSFIPSSVPATCVFFFVPSYSVLSQERDILASKTFEWSGKRSTYQSSITTDEMVHGLGEAQLAHRRQNSKCIAGQEDDVLRVRANTWYLCIWYVLDWVGSSSVLYRIYKINDLHFVSPSKHPCKNMRKNV